PTARRRQRPHLLCHRRHLARVGTAAHVADRLPASRHARLRDAGTGSVRVLRSGAWGRSGDAVADRGGHRCPPAALGLCRAGARKPDADRAAEGHRHLGALRARRPALFDARRRGAREGSADRGSERAQRAALALTRPRRGVDRLDRLLHGVLRARRDRGRAAGGPSGGPSSPPPPAGAPPPTPPAKRPTHPHTPPPRPASISLAVFFRHVGLVDEELSPRLRELISTRVLDRARVLGAALRVAYLVSASTTGVLPKTPMVVERGRLLLRFDNGFKALAGERVFVRLRQLARLIGREPVMEAA